MIRDLSVILMVISALLLAGCSSKVEWNQKLTVTVEIDGQEYVGSSVSRMRYTSAGTVAFGSRGVSLREHIQGEAVVVDLGEHGHLFALWPYQKPGKYALAGKKNKRSANNYKDKQKSNFSRLRKISHSRSSQILDPGVCLPGSYDDPKSFKFEKKNGNYPLLVAFKSKKFPSTITGFNTCGKNWKSGIHDAVEFSKVYGKSAKVKSIVFNITKDPITEGRLEGVLSDSFFQKWYNIKESYGRGGKCRLKTQNSYFCNIHRAMWVRKFPKEMK